MVVELNAAQYFIQEACPSILGLKVFSVLFYITMNVLKGSIRILIRQLYAELSKIKHIVTNHSFKKQFEIKMLLIDKIFRVNF